MVQSVPPAFLILALLAVGLHLCFEMADLLLEHLSETTKFLGSLDAPLPSEDPELRKAFAH